MLDMTKGSPMRGMLAFSIPVLLGNVFNQIYSITDSIIVGRVLGLDALAAVGCTMPIVFLMAAIMFGINGGVSIMLSQAYGSRDMVLMRRYFINSLYLGVLVAIVIAAVGYVISEPVLHLLGTPEGPFDEALSYIRVSFLTSICPLFYYLFACAYRGMGDSRTDLYFLILSVVANIFLDYLFVAVYDWGVAGSAWATALAQLLSVAFSSTVLFIKYPQMRMKREDLKPDRRTFSQIVKLALPIAVQTAFNNLGNIVAQGVVNSFGSVVMAAYTAGGRVGTFALMPLETVGNTLSVYTGQNYGAREAERIHKGRQAAMKLQLIISVALGIVLVLFGKSIAAQFLEEPSEEMLRISYQFLLITAVPGIFAGVMLVYQQLMRGIGKAKEAMYSGLVQLGVKIAVIMAGYFVLRAPVAVWWAWPISFAAAAAVAVWLYKRNGEIEFPKINANVSEFSE